MFPFGFTKVYVYGVVPLKTLICIDPLSFEQPELVPCIETELIPLGVSNTVVSVNVQKPESVTVTEYEPVGNPETVKVCA